VCEREREREREKERERERKREKERERERERKRKSARRSLAHDGVRKTKIRAHLLARALASERRRNIKVSERTKV